MPMAKKHKVIKMKIHLFNPENDLALGLGCRNYTPPPHAAAIHRAGALLPMWWAEDKDLIIAPVSMKDEAEKLRERFGLRGSVTDINGFQAADSTQGHDKENRQASPWGWSLDAKRQFERAQFTSNLPTDIEIEQLRQLSHRRSSIHILKRLDYPSTSIPFETTNAHEAIEFERQKPGCFIKSPWSGSGRGVFCAKTLDEKALLRRVEGIIHRQGSVIIEPGLNKILDFAALFYCRKQNNTPKDGNSKSVEFKGFSIFKAEDRGMYSGNIAAPQGWLQTELSRYVDITDLIEIIEREERILGELTGNAYEGWLGVDMMIHDDNGKIKVMPCIELNLRMTMGVVAMNVCEHLGLKTPHFLAWEHSGNCGNDTNDGTVLLPPTDGFKLKLSPSTGLF